MKNVLFICTGNTCRSPMAAALLEQYLTQNKITGIAAQSAGIAALEGAPAEPNAVAALAELGVELAPHRATALAPCHLQKTDWFVCMTAKHRSFLLSVGVPDEQILVLDIADPYGGDLQTYRHCRDKISDLLPGLVDILC